MAAELKLMPRPLEESVSEILEDAKHQGYETVIVIGEKDGRVFTRASRWRSRLELMGALEWAKQHVWEA